MEKLRRGLIVSCQALKGEPLYGQNVMHLMAKAAVEGGAVGIRALRQDIAAIKATVSVPVIGLTKNVFPDSDVYITPKLEDVRALLETSCEVIAMDATLRARPGNVRLEELVEYVRVHAPGRELMADIAREEDAENAVRLGFDYVSTTLRGYTSDTNDVALPDIAFMGRIKRILSGTKVKMIAEGGIFERDEMRRVGMLDPYAVVVGTAITRPAMITRRLASALNDGLMLCSAPSVTGDEERISADIS